ncbi:hypothetical protein [Bacillus solitudinis]|uniref:hypothetical protein n=1 Tax=Bacillus solitudinis TaxID=2014074 RepID=UPI000C23EAE5|nr:hypothetical protein [Bacillus solitudinis]
MDELLDEQVCPYCEHVVEDHQSNWEDEEEEITCDRCDKEYTVKAVYQFKGFQIEKQCEQCGEWTDDGMALCDCEDKD